MVGTVNDSHSGEEAVERAAGKCNRKPGVGPQRVLHCEHLHLHNPRRVGWVPDLEDEGAFIAVDPEVAVTLAVERCGLAVEPECLGGDALSEVGRDIGRARFQDVSAHEPPRYRVPRP